MLPQLKICVLLVLCAFLFLAASANATPDPQPGFNSWHQVCQFDLTRMRVQVDPIAQFGVSPSAHKHDIFCAIGITSTTAAHATLPVSTRNDPGWTSPTASSSSTGDSYGFWPLGWQPTPYLGGVIDPSHRDPCFLNPDGTQNCPRTVKSAYAKFTYRSPVGVYVNTIPYGMTFVVGNSHATSLAEEGAHVSWTCGDLAGGTRAPQDCSSRGRVTAVAEFPDCWSGLHGWLLDGWNGLFDLTETPVQSIGSFDSPAGIAPSNFAYSVSGACPSGFPVRISQLVVRQHFSSNDAANTPLANPLDASGNVRLSFSSGPFYTWHYDWMETSNLQTEVKTLRCNDGIVDSRTYRTDCSVDVGA